MPTLTQTATQLNRRAVRRHKTLTVNKLINQNHMEKMKAIVYNKKSYPDKLVYCDVDKPVPNDNDVLIKMHSVSLNAADYRSMKMGLIPKRKIFGADIAGRIESVGKNISFFKPGDEVMGDLASHGFGGLAEYVTAPERALIIKPDQVSFEEAATLPMAAMTALQALRDKGNIQKGQKVLTSAALAVLEHLPSSLPNILRPR
jgi:NADPH:quinone reductase-like Zn-dependent oxidoreductase